MSSVNKVILIGNLGKDPETRYMPNGDAVTNITMATTETWKDKDGNKQEKTEWHRVTFYRKLAEIAGEYLKQGKQIYIEGRLETKSYTDKKTGELKYTTGVVANDMKMLGGKKEGGDRHEELEREHLGDADKETGIYRAPKKTGTSFDDMDDDIPF